MPKPKWGDEDYINTYESGSKRYNLVYMCPHQRLTSTCAPAQSDGSLCNDSMDIQGPSDSSKGYRGL